MLRIFLLCLTAAAFLASPITGATMPKELIDLSDEPMESDNIGDIAYSTVLDTSLRSDFLGSSRAERTATSSALDYGSYMTNVDAQGLLSLAALIAGVALVAVSVERFRSRRAPPLSPRRHSMGSTRLTHRPHRSSPLASSPSWPNLPQKSSLVIPA
jgi:hypothetical protein